MTAKLRKVEGRTKQIHFYFILNIIYPYTITLPKHRCTKGLRYGTCLLNMYHNIYHDSAWYMLWYMLRKHIPWLKAPVYRGFSGVMVYGYMFLRISLETAINLLLCIRISMHVLHKLAPPYPLHRLEPPSDPFGAAKRVT